VEVNHELVQTLKKEQLKVPKISVTITWFKDMQVVLLSIR